MTQSQQQNVPALRFSEFSGEWEENILGKFLTFKNGINADKSQYGFGSKFVNLYGLTPAVSYRSIFACPVSSSP